MENKIDLFLDAFNKMPDAKAERDDRRCEVSVFIDDELFFSMTYGMICRLTEEEKQWFKAWTVASIFRKRLYEARKEKQNNDKVGN